MASQYLTLYKMIVLYMLKRSDTGLSKAQIYDFVLDKGYTSFLTLQEVFAELSDKNLILEKKLRNRTFLEITEEGSQALSFFVKDINPEITAEIDRYLKDNKIKLRNESSIKSDYSKLPSGDYQVRLVANERDETILDLKIAVPSEEAAVNVCENWEEDSAPVYQYLISRLLMNNEK